MLSVLLCEIDNTFSAPSPALRASPRLLRALAVPVSAAPRHEKARAALAARASQCGRYWDRTSDPFRVKEVRYRCANRPSMTLKDGSPKGFVNANRVLVVQVILFRLDTK